MRGGYPTFRGVSEMSYCFSSQLFLLSRSVLTKVLPVMALVQCAHFLPFGGPVATRLLGKLVGGIGDGRKQEREGGHAGASRCYEPKPNTERRRRSRPHRTDGRRRNGAVSRARNARLISHLLCLSRCAWFAGPHFDFPRRWSRALFQPARNLRGFIPPSSSISLAGWSPQARHRQELGAPAPGKAEIVSISSQFQKLRARIAPAPKATIETHRCPSSHLPPRPSFLLSPSRASSPHHRMARSPPDWISREKSCVITLPENRCTIYPRIVTREQLQRCREWNPKRIAQHG